MGGFPIWVIFTKDFFFFFIFLLFGLLGARGGSDLKPPLDLKWQSYSLLFRRVIFLYLKYFTRSILRLTLMGVFNFQFFNGFFFFLLVYHQGLKISFWDYRLDERTNYLTNRIFRNNI